VPRLDALLVGLEREHLAIAADHRALGIDHRDGVVDPVVHALEQRARDQPDAVAGRQLAERLLGRPGQRLGGTPQGPEHAQLAEHDHLHPGKTVHQHVDPLGHGREVALGGRDRHLNPGDREGNHALSHRD